MENLELYKTQIEIAKTTQSVLAEFELSHPDARFRKWFHLRPIAKKVTVVSTHPDRPMRGVHVSKSDLKTTIEFLEHCIAADGTTVDWDKIAASYNDGKGFAKGINGHLEYPYQAAMINGLQDNRTLKDLIGVQNLYFVASEVVYRRGALEGKTTEKIDIVAHDGGGKIFFFEMKAPENEKDDPVKQVKEYIKAYGKGGERNEIFECMMKNYPQNLIASINEYAGYGVSGYSENPIIENVNKPLILMR